MQLLPDTKLETATELQDRLQVIFRNRNAECNRSPHDRRGNARPDLMAKQRAKLESFDKRADAIKARLRAMGAPYWR